MDERMRNNRNSWWLVIAQFGKKGIVGWMDGWMDE
jgi:hypothetical protein